MKRFAPTLIGYCLGCLVFYSKVSKTSHGVLWLLYHALLGPFEKPMYVETASLAYTDVLFGSIMAFIMWSHVFSMRRQTVILSLVGAFIWVAAAIGHYA